MRKLGGMDIQFAKAPPGRLSPDAAAITGTIRELLLLAVLLDPSVPTYALSGFDF
jgi:hypothetical protein